MGTFRVPASLLAGLLAAAGPWQAGIARADVTIIMPADVKTFLDRADGCAHWAGEEAYDQMRARQIERAETQLKCDQLDRDGKTLRARYPDDPVVRRAIDSALAEFD
ncbi:MAG TPA: hypothetical protein VL574_15220 [Stellaceae bacterium]|nr:hypothetical protein [Stellaceae bacterium]